MNRGLSKGLQTCFLATGMLAAGTSMAEEVTAKVDTGDTAWVLVSSALVLVMTPGLAFFYAGMVRTKNVVATLFQNVAALAVVGVLWCIAGYSLAFSGNVGGLIGNLNWFMLNGVGQLPNPDYSATIPHMLFMIFQCMFAVITPVLISGAIAERFSSKAWIGFLALWTLGVYSPVAHWVWGTGGWIREMGGLDFAGGLVVHMTAGYSALVAAYLLGKRRDFGKTDARPYDVGMIVLGTSLLWFGWFGFNAGSALGANGLAAQAFVTTFLGAAAAGIAWTLVDNFKRGKPSVIGACVGAVAGLVAITPAAGFVGIGAALVIGVAAGVICNLAAHFVREKLNLDDSLDVFACHGIGGTIGAILTPVFASKAVNAGGADGLLAGNTTPLIANLAGAGAVIAFSAIMTFVIIKALGLVTQVRVSDKDEETGLDETLHGEGINSETTGSNVSPINPAKASNGSKRAA